MKRALLLAAAAALSLVPIELLLQFQSLAFPFVPPPAGPGDTILLLGDSHAEGSLPGALRASLAKRSAFSPEVHFGAWPGANTSELLSRLEARVREEHPRLLVVLAGDANFWNLHHVHLFLDGGPSVKGFFTQLRLAGLLGFGAKPFPPPPPAHSVFFHDVPLQETPTLAMRWAGYIIANSGTLSLTDDEQFEALGSLERWLEDPRNAHRIGALRALTELLRLRHREADALAAEAKFGAGTGGLSASMYRDPRSLTSFLRSARTATDSGPLLTAKSALRAGLRENPFPAGGEPPGYEPNRFLVPEDFISLLQESMPPAQSGSGKPGLDSIRESFLDEPILASWIRHDLTTLVRYARDRGIGVVLSTYAPDPFSGRERAADGAIRKVAETLGVPLVDISAEFRRRWSGRVPVELYGAKSDRLSEEGNAIVAGILAEELARLGLVRLQAPGN